MMKITTEMARYIWRIITAVPCIPMSWGVDENSFVSTMNSLTFHVQGFLHKGNVKIIYVESEDVFQVFLYNEEGEEVNRIDDVYIDNLTEVIDKSVEYEGEAEYHTKVRKSLLDL